MKFYYATHVEASLCAWEHMLESGYDFELLGGTGNARLCCVSLGPKISEGYHIANKGDRMDGYAFDWEFVPWFMENCVIWDTAKAFIHADPDLKPDWREMCKKLDFLPTETELLQSALNLLNSIPNQNDSYSLASTIARKLQK